MKGQNGYLTVYMALCIGVILSLCLTLIEGARRSGAAMEAACVADIGIQSVFAEYHRQLLEQYNLFAIDSSYGTASPGPYNTEARLLYYLEKNVDLEDIRWTSFGYRDFLKLRVDGIEMTKVSILTDQGGGVFRRRAVEAVRDDIGLSALTELMEWMEVIEVNGLDTAQTQQEKEAADKSIREYEYEDEEGEQHVGVENPTMVLEEKRGLGILKLVVEDEDKLSKTTLNTSGLIYQRMKQGKISQGNLALEEAVWMEDLAERLLFQEYLLRYMGRYGQDEGKEALHYQIEYLIAGKENDIDNLRSVANRICALREAANAIYLWNDPVKNTEVELAAQAIGAALGLPAIAPVLKVTMILGWAYAESVYDVKTLLSGGRVPLMKDEASWHYGLTTALSGELGDSSQGGYGMSYEDYLRVFMTLIDIDKLTGRAMDMVEADIRMTDGNGAFCLDGCYDRLEFDIRMSSAFGYEYQLDRTWSYY
ncbi:MAG: hypothetical protein J1E01_04910 [Acetatifactor sp.]|nr:hypothetical protein [Acetatifactor sp.]